MTQKRVNIKGRSDAVLSPDLASLMVTAMALGKSLRRPLDTLLILVLIGAAHSHVSQTTRKQYSDENPDKPCTVTTSTCVSFTFYTPSLPSPFANLDIQANPPPSSPISINSTDDFDGLSESSYTNDDPCLSVHLLPQSTVPPAAPAALAAAPVEPAAAPAAPAIANAVAAVGIDPAAQSSADTSSADVESVPVRTDRRWYCVTVGRQVGVYQGL
jgi:hypothetical protein